MRYIPLCIKKTPLKTSAGIAPAPELKIHWLPLDLSTGLHAVHTTALPKDSTHGMIL